MGLLTDAKYLLHLVRKEEKTSRDRARDHLQGYLAELLKDTPLESKFMLEEPKYMDLGRGFFIRPVEGVGPLIDTEASLSLLNDVAQKLSTRAESLTESMMIWGNPLIFGSKKVSFLLEPKHIQEPIQKLGKELSTTYAHISLDTSASLLESVKDHVTKAWNGLVRE